MAWAHVPGKVQERNFIKEEANAIARLLLSAKNGQWDTVWEILGSPENPKRDRLFNVIPENRRWGILHQAMYWNNKQILLYLLRYSACDSEIRTKQCTSECGDTSGKCALEIAKQYKYMQLADILTKHENKIHDQNTPTFESYDNYNQNNGLGLLAVSLAAYKQTFHPRQVDPSKSIMEILGDIFQDINNSEKRWKEVQDKVCDSVYVVCEDNSNRIMKSSSRHEFFVNIIDTYTEEENRMYTFLNLAFRRQRDKNYRPTGDDLSLGPYAVMYQMLLLYWPDLPRESGETYRKMLLVKSDVDQYAVGKRFVWQSIVSSSTLLDCAIPFPTCGPEGEQSVIFTIDNRANSLWQPRNIEKYARYVEHERTYPAGAKFTVTRKTVKGSDIHIALKLLCN
ncbi:uncharacterized protein LOC128554428 [Mercenaria mercenaria]|uniref:uncharacterized protein LOC128554428 n=1 Tax=Mercenaria mercenaria TaxID=6596 RepID=UPI00234EE697|nr:uncharacterized protein LOC128554428 [Mercenaria mercenaria]